MGRKRDSNKSNNNRFSKRNNQMKQILDDCSDNDSVLNDAASIISIYSNQSNHLNQQQRYDLDDGILSGQQSPDYCLDDDNNNTANNNNGDNNNIENIDDFKLKLSIILDDLQTIKCQKDRLKHYELLIKLFQQKYLAGDNNNNNNYIENRKLTIQEIIENGIKRLDNDESGLAALLFSLTLITVGDEYDEFFRQIYTNLERILIDPTAKPLIRSRVAQALSLGCFITDYGVEKIHDLMNNLLMIVFSNVRGHPDSNQLTAVNLMKAMCLNMFNFLSTITDDEFIIESIDSDINKLTKCLESNQLELRLAAGECIALLFENFINNEDDDDDDLDFDLLSNNNLNELREKFMQLSKDSQKSKSKKELRQQRSNFRQILNTINGETYDTEIIKFGFERLEIDSWKIKRYYDTFCSVLGSGMNIHLSQNPLLRDIFDLGPILLEQQLLINKNNKVNNKNLHDTNRKNREMNRSKMRGKRGDFDY